MRRYRIIVSGALVLCLVAFFAIAAITTVRGDGGSSAAALPTACENFVDATTLMAEQGSAAVLAPSGGDPFGAGAETRTAETLRNLLDACDAELATLSR
jgi:hypothetical protein